MIFTLKKFQNYIIMKKNVQSSNNQLKSLKTQSTNLNTQNIEPKTKDSALKSTLLSTLNKSNVFPNSKASVSQLVSEICQTLETAYLPDKRCSEFIINSKENIIQHAICKKITEEHVNVVHDGHDNIFEKILSTTKNGIIINKEESNQLLKLIIGTQRDLGSIDINQDILNIDKKIIKYGKEIISTKKSLSTLKKKEKEFICIRNSLWNTKKYSNSPKNLKNEDRASNDTSVSTISASILEPLSMVSDMFL